MNIDYKALYEESMARNAKLEQRLDKCLDTLDKAQDAIVELQKKNNNHHQNTRVQIEEGASIHFIDFAESWFDMRSTMVKETTFRKNRLYYLTHIKPYFETAMLTDLTVEAVQRFFTLKAQEGKAYGTLKLIKSVLNMLMKRACAMDFIRKDPMPFIELPTGEADHKRYLTEDERTRLFQISSADRFWILPYLAIETGMRPGELLGLTWDCLDFNTNVLSITATIVKDIHSNAVKSTPKTKGSQRDIPISDNLANKLKQYRNEQREQLGQKNYVLSNRKKNDADGSTHPCTLHSIIKKWGKKANIPKLNSYLFRHSFASLAIENGIDTFTVAKQLGHTTTKLVETVYAHPITNKAQRNCSEVMSKIL